MPLARFALNSGVSRRVARDVLVANGRSRREPTAAAPERNPIVRIDAPHLQPVTIPSSPKR
jgi:hypothetical protein